MSMRTEFTNKLDSLTGEQLEDLLIDAKNNVYNYTQRAVETNIPEDWARVQRSKKLEQVIIAWINRVSRVDKNAPNLKKKLHSKAFMV